MRGPKASSLDPKGEWFKPGRVAEVFDLEMRLRELGSAVSRIHATINALAGEDPAPEVREALEMAGSHLQVFEQMQRAVREADGD